jgi:hypothetical protein
MPVSPSSMFGIHLATVFRVGGIIWLICVPIFETYCLSTCIIKFSIISSSEKAREKLLHILVIYLSDR